jgi:predicted ArsR family transcriptional regulator
MVRRPGSKETDMSDEQQNIGSRSRKARAATSKPKLSRKAQLVAMLSRPRGASQKQLERGLGWQPHSVRAAISVLRKGGAEVTLDRSGRTPTYHIDVAV